MTTVTIAHARKHLRDLALRAQSGEKIVLSRYGQPVAELVCANGAARRPFAEDHFWSEADLKTARDMRREGRSFKEIGRAIGRSRNAVSGQLWRLDHANTATGAET